MKARLLLPTIALCGLVGPVAAQIPNGGFENWTTPPGATYEDPVGWITFNGLTSLFPGMGLSCEKSSPAPDGNYYTTVTTREGTGIGILPGLISIGDATTGSTGFAYTSRPATLTGQWQYNIQPGDSGMVAVLLSKWNSTTQTEDFIGGAIAPALGTLTGWTALNVPFQYQSPATPDTAFVVVASSLGSPVLNSFIKVDALGMSGTFTGIAELDPGALRLYPSPATDRLNLEGTQPMKWIMVLDMSGRPAMNKAVTGSSVTLDVAGLANGRYLLQVQMEDGKQLVRSFVKE